MAGRSSAAKSTREFPPPRPRLPRNPFSHPFGSFDVRWPSLLVRSRMATDRSIDAVTPLTQTLVLWMCPRGGFFSLCLHPVCPLARTHLNAPPFNARRPPFKGQRRPGYVDRPNHPRQNFVTVNYLKVPCMPGCPLVVHAIIPSSACCVS